MGRAAKIAGIAVTAVGLALLIGSAAACPCKHISVPVSLLVTAVGAVIWWRWGRK